jgi:two-component system, cell cycle response regulator
MELRPSHVANVAQPAVSPRWWAARRIATGALALTSLLVAAIAAEAVLGVGGQRVEQFFGTWVYDAVLVLAACLCLARVLSFRGERTVWALFAAGLALWATGDVYYSFFLADPDRFPSLADAFWLAFYVPTCLALGLLVRSRVVAFSASVWLDGVIGALGVAAIGAALVFDPILQATGGSAVAVATNLAYPLADLLLLAVAVGTVGLTGSRPDGTWALLALGFVVFAISDSVYLFAIATGTYAYGLLDVGWLVATVLVAAAAWRPRGRSSRARVARVPIPLLPTAFGVSSLAIVVYDGFRSTNTLAPVLAAGALAAVILRMVLTTHENVRLAEASRREAHTDAVTGLANRRQLLADLHHALEETEASERLVLTLFDLNGFKQYNDTYGHLAGDELLARLAGRLAAAVGAHGRAYRLGGDEFCTLVPADRLAMASAGSRLAALAEDGDGFAVSAAHGSVLIPDDARDPVDALRLGDERMYRHKYRARHAVPSTPCLQEDGRAWEGSRARLRPLSGAERYGCATRPR